MGEDRRGSKPEETLFPLSDYRIRDGVILQTICEESVLVAVGEARHFCPYVQQINESGAYLWRLLETGMDVHLMASRAAEDYGLPVEDITPGLDAFLDMLVEMGYLYKPA